MNSQMKPKMKRPSESFDPEGLNSLVMEFRLRDRTSDPCF
jgi:hypothetical protein